MKDEEFDTFFNKSEKLKTKMEIMEKELKDLLSSYGELKIYKIPYKKFKAQKNVTGDSVYEYLWFINKTSISDFIEEIEYTID